MADFLERGQARQLGDVVAAVGQAPVDAVQVAQLRLGGDDPFEPADQPASLGRGAALSARSWRLIDL